MWQHDLIEAFVAKSMLLVTGIDDVMMLSDRISMAAIRNSLFKAYGTRTRDLGNIITLLNNVWKGIDRGRIKPESRNELNVTAALLYTRGTELAAETGRSLSLGVIGMLAEAIRDTSNDGTDSRAAEDLVISLAVPKVGPDASAAVGFAKSFKLKTGRHRFFLSFLDTYGIANSHQARKIANAVSTSSFHGNEVARKILDIADKARIELGYSLTQKLEKLTIKEKTGFSGILDGLLGSLLGEGLSDLFGNLGEGKMHGMPGMPFGLPGMGMFGGLREEGFPGMMLGGFGGIEDDGLPPLSELMELHSMLQSLIPEGKDSISSPNPFFPRGIFRGETHNHPSLASSKCFECEELPSCPDRQAAKVREAMGMDAMDPEEGHKPKVIAISGDNEEEKLQQLETHLLRICADGDLGRVEINGVPAELFTMLNIEKFSPQARATLQAAIMKI
jgi:hypothetical protein